MSVNGANSWANFYQIKMKEYPSSLANVASSQISLYDEDYENATTEATRAIAKDPNDPEGYVAMAWAMITTGNPETGLELLDRARRLNPTYPNYYSLAIGMAHYSMGDLDKAAEIFAQALERDPGATELALPLAATYANLGKRKEARVALKFWNPNPTQKELKYIPYKYHFPYQWSEDHRIVDGLRDGLEIAILP
jgi:predicted Zn-dependent protease